jgi:hypothetical protein
LRVKSRSTLYPAELIEVLEAEIYFGEEANKAALRRETDMMLHYYI